MKEIKANVSITPEELEQFDKSKISSMAMQDGVIYKISEDPKINIDQQEQQLKQEKDLKKIKYDYSSCSNMYINEPFYDNDDNYLYSIYSPSKRSYGRLIADKGNIMIYESGIETINKKNKNLQKNNGKTFECFVGDEQFVEKDENIDNIKNEKKEKNEKKNSRNDKKNISSNFKENSNFISINREDTGNVYYRNEDNNCPVFAFNSGIKRKYLCGGYVPPRKTRYNYQYVYPNDLGSFNVSKDKDLFYDDNYIY